MPLVINSLGRGRRPAHAWFNNSPIMDKKCVTCHEGISSEDRAIPCNLCESWEHMSCIRQSERPTEAVYETMVTCRSKTIVFVFTSCCWMCGSIVKRLMQHMSIETERPSGCGFIKGARIAVIICTNETIMHWLLRQSQSVFSMQWNYPSKSMMKSRVSYQGHEAIRAKNLTQLRVCQSTVVLMVFNRPCQDHLAQNI